MITLLPEPKHLVDQKKETILFNKIRINTNDSDLLTLAETRFWNYQELITASHGPELSVHLVPSLDGKKHSEKPEIRSQGYALEIQEKEIILYYEGRAGYINGLTSIKMLLIRCENGYRLPCCLIEDWPSVAVRAVAPTFSWYSGYGRIGFDSQLWGYEKWLEFLNICMDNKINQFNMVMY
ncbi:MAG: glycoside hydrolase family 20 zincin-like fold domain-containing protein, partial [Sphaerochaeta sp.]